ncbi:hypothetical protein DFJ74DRAFT_676473 [Hyaloraphidium curvatum]|nr:hypothetical protein DFJ74DRAFT_676473 [Hyaloraphidium curvatum]
MLPFSIGGRRRRLFATVLVSLAAGIAFASLTAWPSDWFGDKDSALEHRLQRELQAAEGPRKCYVAGAEDADGTVAAEKGALKACPPLQDLPKGCPLPPDDLRRDLDRQPVTFCGVDGSRTDMDPKDHKCPVPMRNVARDRCGQADIKSWEVLRSASYSPGFSLPYGCPHQLYAAFSGESAAYYPEFVNGKERGAYNLSVNYRFDSDVPVTYFDPPVYTLRAAPEPYAEKKARPAVATAFVSNCGSHNNREFWLSEMIRLLKVESYGRCHNNAQIDKDIQTRFRNDQWRLKVEVSRRYLFQLVFENSDEPDYVTEKLYQALEAGTVPVYMGAKGQAWRHVPNRTSIIYVADFKDPEALAAHITKVAENRTLYESYLEWKKYPFSKEWKELERIAFVGWRCRAAHLIAGIPFRWRGAFDDQPEGIWDYGSAWDLRENTTLPRTGKSPPGSSFKDPWEDGAVGWKALRRDAWLARRREQLLRGQSVADVAALNEGEGITSLIAGIATMGMFVGVSALVLVGIVLYRAKLRRQRSERIRVRRRGRSMSPPMTLPILIGGPDVDVPPGRLPAP